MPLLVDPNDNLGWPALLVLGRHGESVYNKLKCDGLFIPDDTPRDVFIRYNEFTVPLTEEGAQQAYALGRNLRARYDSFDVVCHSNHERSRNTARRAMSILGQDNNEEWLESPLFNERNSGATLGMTKAEAEAAFPWLPQYWNFNGWYRGIPPGGESIEMLMAGRAWQGFQLIRKRFAGKRVFLAGHGTWILSLRVRLGLESPTVPERPIGLDNCGYLALRFETDGTPIVDHLMRNVGAPP